MNLERDSAPTGFYDYLPRMARRTRKNIIGKLKPGLLKAVGYSVDAPVTRRHAAVKRAVKKYGKSSTIKKLNAVAVLTRRTSPAKSKKFKADMKFAQKTRGGQMTQEQKDLEALRSELEELQDEMREASADEIKKVTDMGVVVTEKTPNVGNLIFAIKTKLSALA